MWVLPSGTMSKSCHVGGSLQCAWCDSTKLKEVDRFPPDRIKYRCKACGKPMTYISTPMPRDTIDRMKSDEEHPYKHIKQRMPKLVKVPGLGVFKIRPH